MLSKLNYVLVGVILGVILSLIKRTIKFPQCQVNLRRMISLKMLEELFIFFFFFFELFIFFPGNSGGNGETSNLATGSHQTKVWVPLGQ